MFCGHPIPGHPPLCLGLHVDDFIQFSADPLVEKQFELDFASKVKVDCTGDVDCFLGICFQWSRSPDEVKMHLSQPGHAQNVVDDVRVDKANFNPDMTPHRSDLPIDTLPEVDMPEPEREAL